MATIKKKPRKLTGYEARPWLKLIPRAKATTDNRARLFLPSGELVLDDRITASPVTMSLDEAATVTFVIADQPGTLEVLALADTDEGRLMSGIDLRWRGLWWRITRIERNEGSWQLVCEDRVAAFMRSHKRLVTASRADVTRAEFVHRLAKGVKAGGGIPVYIPELRERQGVYGAKQRKSTKTASRAEVDAVALDGARGDHTRTSSGSVGWGSAGGKVKVKRQQAKSFHLSAIDTVLSTAQALGASRRVLIACVMCITQESNAGDPYYKKQGDHVRSDTIGTFQQGPEWISRSKVMDDAAATRAFLLGHEAKVGGTDPTKKGWKQHHGSLKAADGDLGEMTFQVQRGGKGASQWQSEATATVDLWLDRNAAADGGAAASRATGSGPNDADRQYRGNYKFRTGDGEPVNWWDATGELADEVQWHRWAVSNTIGFATDGEMIGGNVVLRIASELPGVLGLHWTWDNRREASEMTARIALSDPFQLLPGMVAMVDDEQPVSGRWLVESVEVDPCQGGIADVTLRRPGAKRLEPAPEQAEHGESSVSIGGRDEYGKADPDGDATLPDGSGAARAIAWAERYIGKTESPPHSNRGSWGLDRWQKDFGHSGAPWCGIFVGQALKAGGVKGIASSVASVAAILSSAQAKTNGFAHVVSDKTKGRPGDAIGLFGTSTHVGLIVKRVSGGYETIEGNTSGGAGSQSDGGGVFRKTRKDADVAYVVRPKWPG